MVYNPDDGKTYRVSGALRSPDVFVARIYVGLPVFGETSVWRRAPQLIGGLVLSWNRRPVFLIIA